jgi:L-asparaginase II
MLDGQGVAGVSLLTECGKTAGARGSGETMNTEAGMLSNVVPLAEVTRGGIIESIHVGALAVVDGDGAIVWALGDPALLSFPRSSLKPFQLLPLIQRGGVERFGFTPAEVAVMAGSHSGEAIHVAAVSSVLAKIGAPPAALACGVHPPLDPASAEQLRSAGAEPSALHNNCSGKHSGMLALARLLDAPLAGYLEPDHPAQVAIRAAIAEVLEPEGEMPVGLDGCGAPAYALTLRATARGFARLGDSARAPDPWREPIGRVAAAMRAHPEMVAGTHGRIDTDLMRLNRCLLVKGGAEGYVAVGHPEGQGLALKILDGDAARRAVHVALIAALHTLGWIIDADGGALHEYGPLKPVTNWAGRPAGEVRPAGALRRR